MGYSIMTPFADRGARDSMLEFLRAEYRTIDNVLGLKYDVVGSEPSDSLAYSSRKEKLVVGFDYSPVLLLHEYLHNTCFWMAKTAGKKKNFEGHMLPFVIYDGSRDIALLDTDVTFKSKKIMKMVVDETGFAPCAHGPFELLTMGLTPKKVNDAFRRELARLTQLYIEYAASRPSNVSRY